MKNQNSISKKPPSAVSTKHKNKMMDKEAKQQQQQINEENKNNLNSSESITTDKPSMQFDEKVGCQLGWVFSLNRTADAHDRRVRECASLS
jgi:Pyruvate/2-oxoacid:ferredoxin oxidoreductase delta subunit